MIDRNEQKLMSNEVHRNTDQAIVYQIRVKGHVSLDWADWFGGLTLTLQDNGETLLTGPVIDQSALLGLLRTVRDLGMPLLSVIRVDPE